MEDDVLERGDPAMTTQDIAALVANLRTAADAIEAQKEVTLAYVIFERDGAGMVSEKLGLFGSSLHALYGLEQIKLHILRERLV